MVWKFNFHDYPILAYLFRPTVLSFETNSHCENSIVKIRIDQINAINPEKKPKNPIQKNLILIKILFYNI